MTQNPHPCPKSSAKTPAWPRSPQGPHQPPVWPSLLWQDPFLRAARAHPSSHRQRASSHLHLKLRTVWWLLITLGMKSKLLTLDSLRFNPSRHLSLPRAPLQPINLSFPAHEAAPSLRLLSTGSPASNVLPQAPCRANSFLTFSTT